MTSAHALLKRAMLPVIIMAVATASIRLGADELSNESVSEVCQAAVGNILNDPDQPGMMASILNSATDMLDTFTGTEDQDQFLANLVPGDSAEHAVKTVFDENGPLKDANVGVKLAKFFYGEYSYHSEHPWFRVLKRAHLKRGCLHGFVCWWTWAAKFMDPTGFDLRGWDLVKAGRNQILRGDFTDSLQQRDSILLKLLAKKGWVKEGATGPMLHTAWSSMPPQSMTQICLIQGVPGAGQSQVRMIRFGMPMEGEPQELARYNMAIKDGKFTSATPDR
eukprot:TRINITY_DN52521_c0_g1_i1.p1 TRINITY_DN52521_c0_g1~~TRINITY_DN52521_c0_g1_i1.p1  ORF type:complete len:278 (+),score=25.99 TRINITY_DN52521_c0_g1_i1:67-900(+)